MRKIYTLLFLVSSVFAGHSQNLPLSHQQSYEYLRREQVFGNISENISFNIKPFNLERLALGSSPFLQDSIPGYQSKLSVLKNKKDNIRFSTLPVQLITIYNSSMPDGWENGELVGSVGLQTLLSAGFRLKLGKLSVQFNPSFHYAQNKPFEEYPSEATNDYFRHLRKSVGGIDNPVRYGTSSISNISLGNSHIGANLGGIFIGVSSENIWSGPGQFTTLTMSDNAPGFYHFRIQSTRPLKTFLGNFEGNYWAGQLKSSKLPHFSDGAYQNILGEKDESSWRYFTGFTLSYNPKWIPGFSLGMVRGFQVYRDDMQDNFKAFFPLFAPFQKDNEGLIESRDLRQNQNVSVFSRWLFQSIQTEFYFEYSRNDHPFNWRDLIMSPEHSRAFQVGFSKYIPLQNQYSLGFQSEITQTQFSINNLVRWPNSLGSSNSGLGSYDNFQVTHGWTNKGQVLGSNTGISGNSLIFKVGLYSRLREISVKLEQFENQPNFYEFANTAGLPVKPWMDNSIFFNYADSYGNILLKGSLGLTQASNFNFLQTDNSKSLFSSVENRKTNLSSNLSLIYIF